VRADVRQVFDPALSVDHAAAEKVLRNRQLQFISFVDSKHRHRPVASAPQMNFNFGAYCFVG
jgi:hypothetical protein